MAARGCLVPLPSCRPINIPHLLSTTLFLALCCVSPDPHGVGIPVIPLLQMCHLSAERGKGLPQVAPPWLQPRHLHLKKVTGGDHEPGFPSLLPGGFRADGGL